MRSEMQKDAGHSREKPWQDVESTKLQSHRGGPGFCNGLHVWVATSTEIHEKELISSPSRRKAQTSDGGGMANEYGDLGRRVSARCPICWSVYSISSGVFLLLQTSGNSIHWW